MDESLTLRTLPLTSPRPLSKRFGEGRKARTWMSKSFALATQSRGRGI
jgi:hypothetical protein